MKRTLVAMLLKCLYFPLFPIGRKKIEQTKKFLRFFLEIACILQLAVYMHFFLKK